MATNAPARLSAGDTAPTFTLPDAQGNEVSLSTFAGGRVVVYFYPAAMTPGCTTEAIDFSSSLPAFREAGYEVLGISPDPVERLARFTDKEQLGITLLANPERDVLLAYGAYGEKTLYGKSIEGVIRSTFVVDVAEDGTGTITNAQYNVKATGHVDRLRRELDV
ncbi:MAG TPA: peroxiredoxin [Propionibacteriaceae bacterium]|nr:peroxiredoxin [Propionibacteriaceae bacterium]